ncbi:hypothetical protein A2U01_0034995 [Trifolium medium]|uniref:Uncharacterized protein n=1 Tax=Trifolium medium TaxID=97028 RepID=A0A392PP40_9FABA|nr:hypothetical protein [Trifolium medium]
MMLSLSSTELCNQVVRLWSQISNRITGSADPDHIRDEEDE